MRHLKQPTASPIAVVFHIKKLMLPGGRCPFDEWFSTLQIDDQVMIDVRLSRVSLGTFGEVNFVGAGVCELKFGKGRAIRIYYGQTGKRTILLLTGGDKSTQRGDIKKAKRMLAEFLEGDRHESC